MSDNKQSSTGWDWLRQFLPATQKDLRELETRIMTALETLRKFATDQEAFNATLDAGIDGLVTSINGVAGDITNLNDQIADLKNQLGDLSPEDQARVDALVASGQQLAVKFAAAAKTAADVDALTPPKVS